MCGYGDGIEMRMCGYGCDGFLYKCGDIFVHVNEMTKQEDKFQEERRRSRRREKDGNEKEEKGKCLMDVNGFYDSASRGKLIVQYTGDGLSLSLTHSSLFYTLTLSHSLIFISNTNTFTRSIYFVISNTKHIKYKKRNISSNPFRRALKRCYLSN